MVTTGSVMNNINYGLMTDLYQLTMAAGYFTHGCVQPASFELFVRRLPATRSYLLSAGLAEALDYLSNLRFSAEEVEYLRGLPAFKQVGKDFFNYLREFRFTGDVWALPEGTLVFGEEPLLRVTAPLIQAQIVETYLLSTLNFQTMVATKAARIVRAAREDGKPRLVVEFGTRRAHGSVAGVWAARSAYLAGCHGSSNLAAGHRFGVPVFGTAAHAWTLSFESEQSAFEKFFQIYPDTSTLLIDTYDTLTGARNAAKLGKTLQGVRIDSGDLLSLSRQVREILDQAGLTSTKIVVSGDLNEYSISELVKAGAPIDTFGVGTDLVTSRDAPALGGVYKMVERIGMDGVRHYTAKFSADKVTLPGSKQIFRHHDEHGHYTGDTIGLASETAPHNSRPLLIEVMKNGLRVAPVIDLMAARERAQEELKRLPEQHQRLTGAVAYPIRRSEMLEALLAQVKQDMLG